MANRVLNKPPAVQQGQGYKCWAAALSSWLVVTPGRPQWTQEVLLNSSRRFWGPFEVGLPEGAINAEIFKRMAVDDDLQLSMAWEEIPQSQGLADDYLYQLMAMNGYLCVIYTPSSQVTDTRHAVVVWSADTEGNIAVMNPQVGAYQNKTSWDLGSPMLVAYNSKPLW